MAHVLEHIFFGVIFISLESFYLELVAKYGLPEDSDDPDGGLSQRLHQLIGVVFFL